MASPPKLLPEPAQHLSAGQARRIALAAQGFATPRPAGRVDARHLRRVIDQVGLLQIDSVNVLSRSHYLPVFARLGPYPRSLLDQMAWGGRRREMFEYWAHEASLLPMSLHHLLRWRMGRARTAFANLTRLDRERPGFVEQVLALVAEQGPVRSGALATERPRTPGSMWNWHDGKIALEVLFYDGKVTTSSRPNFERVYDIPERVIPPEVLARATPDPVDAHRELVRIAARCLGVATEADLRDYFRQHHSVARPAIAELVETGELMPVVVEGWAAPAYLWHGARRPRRVSARALLSPFDSLVWFRPRTERLFGMRYRIEIYTPAPQRIYGYYVLPFLLGDTLVARVDLKADRPAGVLRVQAAHAEPGCCTDDTAAALAEELALMAGWLQLERVAVMPCGDLAAPLARQVGPATAG
ncbi:MAG: winged helix-turn-helix domain-containing protein [Mycobacteriales bacterium]|nr:MAG: cytoplasmic protein [Pseudonocardiales bacterium]